MMSPADTDLLRSLASAVADRLQNAGVTDVAAVRQLLSKPTPSTVPRIAAALCAGMPGAALADLLEGPDTFDLAAQITLHLLTETASLSELDTLVSRSVLHQVAPDALLVAAEVSVEPRPEIARAFLRAALPGITSLQQLASARRAAGSLPMKGAAEIRVAVIGNCTLNPMAEAIEMTLQAESLAPRVLCADYDRWAQELFDNDSETSRLDPDLIVVYLSSLGLSRSATALDEDVLTVLQGALEDYWTRRSGEVFLVMPEALEEERLAGGSHGAWRRSLLAQIRERFEGRALLIDPHVAVPNWPHASRYYYHAKYPCHPDGLVSLGLYIGSVAAKLVRRDIKVVVTDLDETLWGGVLGDEGWSGVNLDIHAGGAPYLRLQSFLAELKQRGTILCIASKNDENAVAEVFEKRPEMILSLDDFAAIHAGWRPKSESLQEMATDLNLGLESFCFIDDSPQERGEIRSVLADVIVPELPTAPEEFVPSLLRSGLFHAPRLTSEDVRRTELYQAESARRASRSQTTSLAEYLAGLHIVVEPEPIDGSNFARVGQLVAKTNQFNLTTRRHDIATLRQLAEREECFTWCYRVRDCFGDSGLVGVLIAQPLSEPSTYIVDTWILSCRVMGRTVEHATFRHLLAWLRERGVGTLIGEYIRTDKNSPVADLFAKIGFEEDETWKGDGRGYRFDTSAAYEGVSHATLDESVTTSEGAVV
jgi:FkbH-like protein